MRRTPMSPTTLYIRYDEELAYGLMCRTPMSPTTLYIRYDEELALADAREREVKSRTGHRGKLKTEHRKPVSWK